MKEYWVNVYEHPLTNERWLGNRYQIKERSDRQVKLFKETYPNEVKYRIHVKIKDKSGLSRKYPLIWDKTINRPEYRSW